MARSKLGAMMMLSGMGIAALYARSRQQRAAYSFAGRTVVITGGSRGLGLVTARHFMREGAHVAVLARDVAELERAQDDLVRYGSGKVMTLQCDVRVKESVDAAIEKVIREFGAIDVLMNNAGIIKVGPIEHMSMDDFGDAMQTHFWGALHMVNAVLPHMKARREGRIVNIASIGGKIAVPHLAPYSASKFALVGFSDSLRAEVAEHNIHVTTVLPAPMRTGSHYNAMYKGENRKEFAWFALASSLPLASLDADMAASMIVDSARRGAAQLVIAPPARIALVANEVIPGVVAGALKFFNALLPRANSANVEGNIAKTGWESRSAVVPSVLTQLNDQATVENNEIKTPGQAFSLN